MIFSEDYIIRIYRFEPGETGTLAGTAEKVGEKKVRGFSNFEELRTILTSALTIPRKAPDD
jgi:hypothetical protein